MSATTPTLAAQAERLRDLHRGERPLVLPNPWDATSARVLADAGFPALASSSAAVAQALGGADGDRTPAKEMFAALARIGAVAADAGIPLTADVENGYGLGADELVERLLEAGAVGLNLEDTDHAGGGAGLLDAGAQAERIAAVKQAGRDAGVDLVLNARLDACLRGAGVEESLARARRYVAAGADCVYPILLEDEAALARHVAEAGAPVNALLHPGSPSVERYAQLGVARVSTGGALANHAYGALGRAASSLLAGEDPWAA
jgi:2-methylisocitrate lyase-like PEP mutase family enzyme